MQLATRPDGHLAKRLRVAPAIPLLALVLTACSPGGDAAPPNVLLVVLDTTRADVLSSYGNAKPTTPHVDRLAAEGTRFTRVFSTAFWTLPAHASLLTGRYPSGVGATSETNRLPDGALTLAERLRESGWRTGAFVSNAWLSAERGFSQGFETFEETWRAGSAGDFQLDKRGVTSASAWMTDRVAASEPFFVLLNLNTAHLPYSPDPLVLVELTPEPRPLHRIAHLRRVKGMWSHLGGTERLDAADYSMLRELYEAEVAMIDELVGELIDLLERLHILDDTLVIVTSDHGENIGEHGMIDHLLSMYDTTLHVPLVIRHPAAFEAGRIDDGIASLIDVVPTVLDVVGLAPLYADGPGRSLVGKDRGPHDFVIAENDRPVNGIELMHSLFPEFDTTPLERRVRTLRTERYKLIWYSDGEVVLFDLENDPGEERNLASERPALREELLAELSTWMDAHPSDEESVPLKGRDPESTEQLRALGYIE
ncbi:MAG: sulfatase [Deltaproteobacteria bacterium]|nr:sulfatase [Deltaproteobacteria bacterium]